MFSASASAFGRGLLAAVVLTALAAVAAAEISDREPAPPAGFALRFTGLAAFEEAALRRAAAEELADFERRGFRRADIDDAAFQMERALRRAGFAFAEVAYRIESGEAGPQVSFEVVEGPRVTLEAIVFEGNAAFDHDRLAAFFSTGESRPLSSASPPFVRAELEEALQELAEFYREEGFAAVRIATPEIRFSDDRSRAVVRIAVHEGERHIVREVALTGDRPAEAAGELEALVSEFTGRPYSPRLKSRLGLRIEEILADRGYADAAAAVEERSAGEPGAVRLAAAIEAGPLVTVSEVIVRGDRRTAADFIRRRVKLAPGDRTSREKEQESFRELYRTGLFSRVRVALGGEPGAPARPLLVEVEEAPSRELYLEPGWGSYEQLRLKAGFREKNLFGRGIVFGSEAKVSAKERGGSLGLTDPGLFGSATSTHGAVYLLEREEPAFTRSELGLELLVSRRLSPSLTASAGYRLKSTELAEVDVAPIDQDAGEDYDLGSVTLQIARDTRDDLFYATRGGKMSLSAELAASFFGGDVDFLRLAAEARHFFSLSAQTVLALRYGTGVILPGPGKVAVPIAERFFNGGENSVRSFRESELGPRSAAGDPTGGYAMNVAGIELRRRLLGNLCGSLFFDLGNLSPNRSPSERGERPYESRRELIADTFRDYFAGFRPAVGVGLQYLTPVGPARLDLAVNPARDPGRDEEAAVLHFSVGMAF